MQPSALRFACDEVVNASSIFHGRGFAAPAAQRLTRSLWWIVQLCGRATPDSPDGTEFMGLLESGQRRCDAVLTAALRVVDTARRVPGHCERPDVFSVLVAAALVLGMFGHTPLGKVALQAHRIQERAGVFEALCSCTEDSCAALEYTAAMMIAGFDVRTAQLGDVHVRLACDAAARLLRRVRERQLPGALLQHDVALLRAACAVVRAASGWDGLGGLRSAAGGAILLLAPAGPPTDWAALLLLWLLHPVERTVRDEVLLPRAGREDALEALVCAASPALAIGSSSRVGRTASEALEPESPAWSVLETAVCSGALEEQQCAVRLVAALAALAGPLCAGVAALPPIIAEQGAADSAGGSGGALARLRSEVMDVTRAASDAGAARADFVAALLHPLASSGFGETRMAASLAWRHLAHALLSASLPDVSPRAEAPAGGSRVRVDIAALVSVLIDSVAVAARWSECLVEEDAAGDASCARPTPASVLSCDPDVTVRTAALGTWLLITHWMPLSVLYEARVFAAACGACLRRILRAEPCAPPLHGALQQPPRLLSAVVKFCLLCLKPPVTDGAQSVRYSEEEPRGECTEDAAAKMGGLAAAAVRCELPPFYCPAWVFCREPTVPGAKCDDATPAEGGDDALALFLLDPEWLPRDGHGISDAELFAGPSPSPAETLAGLLEELLLRPELRRGAPPGLHGQTRRLCTRFAAALASRQDGGRALVARILSQPAIGSHVAPELLRELRQLCEGAEVLSAGTVPPAAADNARGGVERMGDCDETQPQP